MSNIFEKLLQANKITTIQDGDKVIIACDAVLSEEHNLTSEATQHEIEDGSLITDHIINRGRTLRLECLVSDDPLTYLQTGMLERTINSTTPELFRSKLGFGLSDENGKPSKDAFDQLEKIYEEKRPVTVVTGLKKYDNMVMESLNIPRNKDTVRSLKFDVSFRQIKRVSTKMVSGPSNENIQEEFGSETKKNNGSESSKSNLTGQNQTFAVKVYDFFTNLF